MQSPEIVQVPQSYDIKDIKTDLSDRDWAALYLAWALLIFVFVATVVIMVDYLANRPAYPDLSKFSDPKQQKEALENFRLVGDIAWERTSRSFDLVVVRASFRYLPLSWDFYWGIDNKRDPKNRSDCGAGQQARGEKAMGDTSMQKGA